jgi:hypothetical protein
MWQLVPIDTFAGPRFHTLVDQRVDPETSAAFNNSFAGKSCIAHKRSPMISTNVRVPAAT